MAPPQEKQIAKAAINLYWWVSLLFRKPEEKPKTWMEKGVDYVHVATIPHADVITAITDTLGKMVASMGWPATKVKGFVAWAMSLVKFFVLKNPGWSVVGIAAIVMLPILIKLGYGPSRAKAFLKKLFGGLKSVPRRENGKLVLTRAGEFPFPTFLVDAIKMDHVLTEDIIDKWYSKSPTNSKTGKEPLKGDAFVLKFMFVPVNNRRERFSLKTRAWYHNELAKMGYTKRKVRDHILRYVSEYDILERGDVVRAARQQKQEQQGWGKKYMALRGY